MNLLLKLLGKLHISAPKHHFTPKAKALLLRADANHILLIQHPQEGQWRLPGAFVRNDESAYEAVTRALLQLISLQPGVMQPIAREDENEFRVDASFGDLFQMYSTLFWVEDWQAATPAQPSEWQHKIFTLTTLPPNCHPEVQRALHAWQHFVQTGHLRLS